jgi:hypothetical protein
VVQFERQFAQDGVAARTYRSDNFASKLPRLRVQRFDGPSQCSSALIIRKV